MATGTPLGLIKPKAGGNVVVVILGADCIEVEVTTVIEVLVVDEVEVLPGEITPMSAMGPAQPALIATRMVRRVPNRFIGRICYIPSESASLPATAAAV